MKRLCIFLFSGTGMTKYVVEKIRTELEGLQVQADIYPIEKTQPGSIPLDSYDAMSVAYPVHAFNAPQIVVDFVKQLPQENSLNTFIISTAGADSMLNSASSKLLIRILNQMDYSVLYDKQLVMPSNFVVKYDESQVIQLVSAVNEEIPRVARDILNLTRYERKTSLRSNFMTWIGRIEWLGARFAGKLFYADKNCSHCGICAANCPNGNIASGKGIRFSWHCGLCMRCLYLCPRHAVKVHRPFKFISFDEWYKNEDLSVLKSIGTCTGNAHKPPGQE